MAITSPSRKERAAAVANGLFAPLEKRELLAGLGEVVTKSVALTSIEPNPRQPRQSVDEGSPEFQDLVGSIRQQGLLQPINLWQLDEDQERYVIIAGERRWRAFRRLAEENAAKFSRISATVTILSGDRPEARALMMGLIENVVREDLRDGERADALGRLKETTGWTYEQIAERMGMAVNRVMGLASIARHEPVRRAVDEGTLTQKQAIVIGQGVKEPELAAALVSAVSGLDERTTRAVVQAARRSDPARRPGERAATAVASVAAQGVAVLGATPKPAASTATTRTWHPPAEDIPLARTPLAKLMGRATVTRAEILVAVRDTCDQLNLWSDLGRR